MPRAAAIPEDDYATPAAAQIRAALALLGWNAATAARETQTPVDRVRRAMKDDDQTAPHESRARAMVDRRRVARMMRGDFVEFIPAAGRFGPGVRLARTYPGAESELAERTRETSHHPVRGGS
ncbi:hypothetical protein [Salinarimonas rosea]|uniref:hypothetical protein n=1 Tax=Salinarimonas rosea TaxID=552063 RepID=UPI00041D79ED|nr:hypothetical protein [Salinarimonas rosea]